MSLPPKSQCEIAEFQFAGASYDIAEMNAPAIFSAFVKPIGIGAIAVSGIIGILRMWKIVASSITLGFKAFTGGLLERLLRKTTDGVWKSLTFGVLSTTVMQSSSLVSVITISFLSAGLISLAAGIGIIFGANLGTTTGALVW